MRHEALVLLLVGFHGGVGGMVRSSAPATRRLRADSATSSKPPSWAGWQAAMAGPAGRAGTRPPGKQPGAPGVHLDGFVTAWEDQGP